MMVMIKNFIYEDKSYVEPKLIEFFVKKNLTVIEVALGEHHSMALT